MLRFEALDDSNASMWFHKMKSALIYKKLWSVVVSTPETGDDDAMALAMIRLCVKDHHLGTLSSAKTAKEAWKILEDTFKAKTKARRLQLVRDLHGLRKSSSETLAAYFGRVRILRDHITQAGEEVDEDHVVCALLAGLPEAYDMIVAILTSKEEAMTLDDAYKQLVSLEQRSMSALPIEDQEAGRALMAKKAQGKGGGERRSCYYCGETGHLRPNCPVKAKADAIKFPGGKPVFAM